MKITNITEYSQARRELTDLNRDALNAERAGEYKEAEKLQREAAEVSYAMMEFISTP